MVVSIDEAWHYKTVLGIDYLRGRGDIYVVSTCVLDVIPFDYDDSTGNWWGTGSVENIPVYNHLHAIHHLRPFSELFREGIMRYPILVVAG
jgi:hypothetical protein